MGDTNEQRAVDHIRYIFKKIGATLDKEDVFLCLNTDELLSIDNRNFVERVACVAQSICEQKE